jgi:hypothetical protein
MAKQKDEVLFLGGTCEIYKNKKMGGSVCLRSMLKGSYVSSKAFIELLKGFGVDVDKLNNEHAVFLRESAAGEE